MINEALPEDLRRPGRELDAKGVKALFQEIADKHPDKYKEVARKLTRMGGEFAYSKGGLSFGIRHLRQGPAARMVKARIRAKLARILADRSLDPAAREKAIVDMVNAHRDELETAIFDEQSKLGSPLALQVAGGVRGNKGSLRTLLGGDLLYDDHKGRTIPIPVLRSYAEGLTPAEYWAGSYGTRAGVIAVKQATADAGALSKQLVQSAHRRLVTALDAEEEDEDAPNRGYPVDAGDDDSVGSLLARETAGFPRNTVITPKVLKKIRDAGAKRILVRSPIVGGPADGGLYARDVGVREKGVLAPVGDYVGHAAAQALSEPLSQGQLCLAAGTLVRMADGSDKPIEAIRIGDWVLGANRRAETFPVRVSDVFDNGEKGVFEYGFSATVVRMRPWRDPPNRPLKGEPGGDFLAPRRIPIQPRVTATADHKILARLRESGGPDARSGENRVEPLRDLAGGDDPFSRQAVIADLGGYASPILGALAWRSAPRSARTHDIEVDHPDHLFVLANGLIVSNSAKHSGGVAGAGGAQTGFKAIERLVNPPKVFPGAAAHAQRDGRVQSITELPQGGFSVAIDGEAHYAPPGLPMKVKVGDVVEAGDVLTEGLPNPNEIVKHKGIGDGRRYFIQTFRDVFRNSGMGGDRRNMEVLARGLIDHVQLDDEVGSHVPGDVVSYSTLAHGWEPRAGSNRVAPTSGIVGKYLERPVLHYTVGTKIRPSHLRDFAEFGVKRVDVHPEPPPFHPVMVRGMAQLRHDPDWMTRHLGSNLMKSTLDAAHRGAVADAAGTSFVSALLDPTSFGRGGKTKGWDPKAVAAERDLLGSDDLLSGL